jgi:CubicO group peptidase (beta-lactamase class C family)
MTDLTRRGLMGAAAALAGGAATAGGESPLAGLIAEGPDGLLSAGLIARRGDGSVALAASAGRRITGAGVASPFGLDDPFRVASISKMIAATGFMGLVEAGRTSLDEDVSGPLGWRLRHPAFADRPILIRHLLSHTSALRNGPSYPVPAGHALREAFEPSGRHWDGGAWFGPADRAPGDWFAYADVNFCVIAQIIERLTGERFDRYMSRTVLAPLGLDAGYNWSGVTQGKRDRAAPAWRWLEGRWTIQTDGVVPAAPAVAYSEPADGPPVAEADLKLGDNGFLFSPQGGLRISVRDLDRLAQMYRAGGALAGTRVIAPAALARMVTPAWRFDRVHPNGDTGELGSGAGPGVFGGYGLGVEIPQGRPGPGGDAFFGAGSGDWRGHLGDAYGWMTGLFWNLADGRTLAWALNGMRETGRPPGRRSALTPGEEAIIDIGLAAAGPAPETR